MTTAEISPAPLRPRSVMREIKAHVVLLFGLVGVMWLVEILDLLPFLHLDRFGIHPRTTAGLLGLVTAPFLHVGVEHLMLNSIPFIILGGTVLLSGVRVFWGVSIFVSIVGGLGVWLFAPGGTNHIGASGVIFGYLGFLVARGIFERSLGSILVAAAIVISYGGLLAGVLPFQSGISWQGHLFGFLAGIAAARWIARKKSRPKLS